MAYCFSARSSTDYSPLTTIIDLDQPISPSFLKDLSSIQDSLKRRIHIEGTIVTIKEMETRFHSRCSSTFMSTTANVITQLAVNGTDPWDTGIRLDATGCKDISFCLANNNQVYVKASIKETWILQ